MNGATAKLWREPNETGNDTGGTSDLPSVVVQHRIEIKVVTQIEKVTVSIVARPKPISPSIHKYM